MSTINDSQGSGVGRRFRQKIESEYHSLKHLPMEGYWTWGILGSRCEGVVNGVDRLHPLEKVDTFRMPESLDRRSQLRVWTVDHRLKRIVEDENRGEDDEHTSGIEPPCEHSGVKNVRDSPWYRCSVCGARFTREEIDEHNE